jgi:Dyp-type peroxidase family
MPDLDLKDIQGLIVRGYRDLDAATYLLLGIQDGEAARHWLVTLDDQITDAETRTSHTSLHVAFTHAGLVTLGIDAETLATFPNEFTEGMTSERRRIIFGDHGENAPEKWVWGGPKTLPVHILLMLFAVDEPTLQTFSESLSRGFSFGGVTQIGEALTTTLLRDAQTGYNKEHFGFNDAVSQPFIEGLGERGSPANTVKAGEFILGYPNEYDLLTESPAVRAERDPQRLMPDHPSERGAHDLGRNGSYLAFRQLYQDVGRFWQYLDDVTKDANGSSNPEARLKLAAKMVGRWPSGAPLVRTAEHDNPELGQENDFGYHGMDSLGLRCPLGAHIRRSNPRDSLDPNLGSRKALDINNRHRILRRGRAYGKPVSTSMRIEDIMRADTSGDRGLHFICFNGNISRQFEFVHQTWINNPKFAGLYEDTDPLIGDRASRETGQARVFTEQAMPVRRRLTNPPQFVFVRGGAYFFMPSKRAVRYLGSMKPVPPGIPLPSAASQMP